MALIKKNAYFYSTDGENTVRTAVWENDELEKVAVIQISHAALKNIDDYEDPSKILQENIIRASRLLDHLEDEIDLGITPKGGTSRMLEVATLLINSITTNPPSMFPNRRIQSDNGRITISSILRGAIRIIGCPKSFSLPRKPCFLICANSMTIMLIMASPAVTFKSFVGGLKPNNPIKLANTR